VADLTTERAAELRRRIELLYPLIRDAVAEADKMLSMSAAVGARNPRVEVTLVLQLEFVHALSVALCIAVGMTTEGEEARNEIFLRGHSLLHGAG
jgi:hypothetical protein